MLLPIIIFFIAIIIAFGMLVFRAWQLRTNRVRVEESAENPVPDLTFRHVEKSMLYLTKRVVQNAILVVAKYWFIFTTKAKKKIADNWPKIDAFFHKKSEPSDAPKKPSFFRKAILESEAKIKKIKEKVKEEHE